MDGSKELNEQVQMAGENSFYIHCADQFQLLSSGNLCLSVCLPSAIILSLIHI